MSIGREIKSSTRSGEFLEKGIFNEKPPELKAPRAKECRAY
jgi:hypothetical protein